VNYKIPGLLKIIRVSDAAFRQAAKVCGLRVIGDRLCLGTKMVPVDFITECWEIEKMLRAARVRNEKARSAQSAQSQSATPA
jgi:hypothetical protein